MLQTFMFLERKKENRSWALQPAQLFCVVKLKEPVPNLGWRGAGRKNHIQVSGEATVGGGGGRRK